jgi:hypothetical protein
MPKVSTSGMTNNVAPVFDSDFEWSAGDTLAAIFTLTADRTFDLPGPGALGFLGNTPTPGDYYEVADPAGLITGGNTITVRGNGALIQGAATIVLNEQYAAIRFTYMVNPVTGQAYWLPGFCSCGGG